MKRDQSKNGNWMERGFQRIQEAQANLNHAMAALLANQAAFQSERREIKTERRESETEWREFNRVSKERFRRIEAILELHTRLLEALPDAVREKMGFRAPAS